MVPPQATFQARLARMGWLKTVGTVAILAIIYVWCSAGLEITPSQFLDGHTWQSMGQLVVRLGPFYQVNKCDDAKVAWGDDEPLAGKPNPAKVKSVCEEGGTEFLFYRDYLDDQKAFLKDIAGPLLDTFRMAIVGAFFGAILAVPFALLAARNLIKIKLVYYIVRFFVNLIRTIPDLVWAALFTGALGVGALPGVLALIVFSFGMNAKLLSESIETIDQGPLEAMQACGASWLQQIRYGVVPQVLPQFLAYGLYVLEIDVRASTVLGLVGAGGIGVLFNTQLTLGRWHRVGVIVLVMLIVVWAMDFISTRVRERLI
jgi:phosphonate transport system permease protein